MSEQEGSGPSDPGLCVRAVVRNVREGQGYVVAYPQAGVQCSISERDSITFSLAGWQADALPEKGQVVDLSDVRLFVKGWCARSASPVRS